MARGDTAARQLRLLWLLFEGGSVSVDSLSERLSCTTRTVYRDLDGLQRAGIPLYQEQLGRTSRWRLVESYNRRLSVQLTVHEAMALVASEQFMAPMQGSLFAAAAKQAVAKVRHALDPQIRSQLDGLSRHITMTPAPLRKLARQRPYLEQLFKSMERNEVVRIEYRKLKSEQPEVYTVEPHSLNVQGSAVHLVAWARERKAPRVFLLDRVMSVESAGERFTARPELGPGAFDQGSFGLWNAEAEQIVLRFRGTAARIVSEQQFHPTQILSWEGTVLRLEMTTPVSPSLRAWVRGFGERVEVVQPANLLEARDV